MTETALETTFEAFIRQYDLVRPGQSVVIAVSGGLDSMAMLHLFAGLRSAWNLRLAVAHVNHRLRGAESDDDEDFVRKTAAALDLPCHSKRVDTIRFAHDRRLSKQEAARELRYSFFEEVRLSESANSVATAHQANDNAETVLLNILRGTGTRGLAGIPLKRVIRSDSGQGNVIRPLLFARRQEIEEFARRHHITYRNDSSNESLAYDRNLLRRRVIPKLQEELRSDIVDSLNKVASVMRDVDASLDAEVARRYNRVVKPDGHEIILRIGALHSTAEFLREHIILRLLRLLDIEPTEDRISRILELPSRPTGKSLPLSDSYTMFRDRDRLVIRKHGMDQFSPVEVQLGNEYKLQAFCLSVGAPGPAPGGFSNDKHIEFVDARCLINPMILRPWKEGDWFIPLGMRHRKKLSDFFVDNKVPLYEKEGIPVLESYGRIVWVCGLRLDDRFKVKQTTRRAVKLSYLPLTPDN